VKGTEVKERIQNIIKKFGYEIRRITPEDDTSIYKQLFPKESVLNRRFYNISAGGHLGFGGGFSHPCWTNVDLGRNNNKHNYNEKFDIEHELLSLKPLPIESETAELVHSRFSIEHITNEAAEVMFNEVYRILKPKGIFRVLAPNIDLDYFAYLANDISYFFWRDVYSSPENFKNYGLIGPLRDASIEQVFLIHFASNASTYHREGPAQRIDDDEFRRVLTELPYNEALDYCTQRCSVEVAKKYRINHINWWNTKKLERFLKKAGFRHVNILAAHQSACRVFRNRFYFDNFMNDVALFVEAIK
jgi:predicted SAM-dependent methyltransferase